MLSKRTLPSRIKKFKQYNKIKASKNKVQLTKRKYRNWKKYKKENIIHKWWFLDRIH